jgi:hypothetical protein
MQEVTTIRRNRRDTDRALVAALAAGRSQADAAASAGVSERTVRRRLGEAGFRSELDRLRAETVRATADALKRAALQAVETLVELQGPSSPPAVRLGAARAVLDHLVRYQRTAEFDERLRQLETAADSRLLTVAQ